MSQEFGKHLLEVEDLLQKHKLMEADMAIQAEKIRAVNAAALKFASGDGKWPPRRSFIPEPLCREGGDQTIYPEKSK